MAMVEDPPHLILQNYKSLLCEKTTLRLLTPFLLRASVVYLNQEQFCKNCNVEAKVIQSTLSTLGISK